MSGPVATSSVAPATPPVGRRVVMASAFMVGLRLAFRGIGFVSTLFLVRLLTPSDFGLVGLAMAVFSILDTLTDLSFGAALIRLPVLRRDDMDTVWTLGVIRCLAIGGAIALSAGFTAEFMKEPRVEPILWAVAAMVVLQCLENVALVEFRRDLRFDRIFAYQISGKLVGFCVTVPGAFLFRSYWVLVAGIAAMRLAMIPYGYIMRPYRPRLSLASWRHLFHFSKWFMLTNVLTILDGYVPSILFSRIGGPGALGTYQVAWQIASLPAGEIAAPIREPIYSGYARLLDDPPALRRQFVDGFALLIMVIVPMSVGLALTGDLIADLFLGPSWVGAGLLIRLCTAYALFDAVGHFTHNLFVVLNRQKAFVVIMAVVVAVRLPLLLVTGITWGMSAAVLMLAATAAFNGVLWMSRCLPLLHLSPWVIVQQIWRTIASCAVMALAVQVAIDLPAGDGGGILALSERLGTAVLVGAVVQVATQYALWQLSGAPDGPERRLLAVLHKLRHRLRSTLQPRPLG
jgi:lipopolysaccharide exporter